MEFVDLNSSQPTLDLKSKEFIDTIELVTKPTLQLPKVEHTEQDVETFNLTSPELQEDNDDTVCVRECSHGSNIKCTDKSGYFSVDNLFGELKTEYDKQVARANLGIGNSLLLKWGNILGNLANQTDLVKFITEQITISNDSLYNEIMQKIDDLDTSSTKTTIYYGPSVDSLTKSTSTTFTTGDYTGCIYVLTPNENTTFKVNGICGGFEYVKATWLEEQIFYLFKSTYEKLGVTTITVSYG